MKSNSVKGKGKSQVTEKRPWTRDLDSTLELALQEHPNEYAKILKDPKYSKTFEGYDREKLRVRIFRN
jgi:hypothetical protein